MTLLTILVVEDEAVVRNLLVAILQRAHYTVLEADSAAEAFQISTGFEGGIDLVIADHTLKTMTGREVAESLREARPGMKVLHISGYPRGMLEERGGIVPGAGFLAKPFRPNELIEKISELFLGRSYTA